MNYQEISKIYENIAKISYIFLFLEGVLRLESGRFWRENNLYIDIDKEFYIGYTENR